ncbi:hypothetical protein H5410_041840 [Solanum commersonii]|uniref:Uncharacterized protein n=1 Tax=Solanum commersonii TaxID=4109 RepID=A0A9J5XWR9_SOLCO|nr:hypothetical protein H5410_041840 [Solanum commersonii]
MFIKSNGDKESTLYYDLVFEAGFFSIKINHMGLMKHQPSKTYVGGMVDYFDYAEAKNLNLADLK